MNISRLGQVLPQFLGRSSEKDPAPATCVTAIQNNALTRNSRVGRPLLDVEGAHHSGEKSSESLQRLSAQDALARAGTFMLLGMSAEGPRQSRRSGLNDRRGEVLFQMAIALAPGHRGPTGGTVEWAGQRDWGSGSGPDRLLRRRGRRKASPRRSCDLPLGPARKNGERRICF